MLVPGSEEGTPQSIQDRAPSTVPVSGVEIPTTDPASSGAVRMGVGRTGSDVSEGQVGVNAILVDSNEEPLVRFTATQQDAPVLCAESQGAVVVDDDLGTLRVGCPSGAAISSSRPLAEHSEEQHIRSFRFG